MRTTRLFAYRLPAEAFRPFAAEAGDDPNAMVSTTPVEPLGPPDEVGDLLACHAAAGIQLRLLEELWPCWDQVVASTVGFSGIRLRNALPRH